MCKNCNIIRVYMTVMPDHVYGSFTFKINFLRINTEIEIHYTLHRAQF